MTISGSSDVDDSTNLHALTQAGAATYGNHKVGWQAFGDEVVFSPHGGPPGNG